MICTVVQASGVEGGIVDGRCTNTGRLVSGREHGRTMSPTG